MNKILVVEDDIKLNQIICTYLGDNGYSAFGCLKPEIALDLLQNEKYDLLISDIMMPGIDGFELVKYVREDNKTIPILFITALDDICSKKKGFRVGIDDYLVKPFDLDELVLRIGALLRRANIASEKKISIGNLTLDSEAMTATVNKEDVPITVREFNILFKLLSYPKHTFSRSQLMDEFWDVGSETSLRAVDVYITKLRDKFENCDGFKIVTVHGLGYKAILL